MSRRPSGIMARIRQMAPGASENQSASTPSSGSGHAVLPDEVADLQARIAHLEQMVQGLQDSVHRGSERQDRRLSDIEKRLEPAAIAAALSQDARERGI